MTSPAQPIESVDVAVATAGEVKRAQGAEGQPWQLLYGNVVAPPGDDGIAQVVVDKDTAIVPALTLGQIILPDDRVAIAQVPPNGSYVIGVPLRVQPAGCRLLVGGTAGGTQIASTTSASEIQFNDFSINVPLVAGHIVYLRAAFQFFINSTAAVFVARIRETNLAGATVGSDNLVPGAGNSFTRGNVDAWIKATATKTQTYVVTGLRNTGAASWGADSAGNTGHGFFAFDYGASSIVPAYA